MEVRSDRGPERAANFVKLVVSMKIWSRDILHHKQHDKESEKDRQVEESEVH